MKVALVHDYIKEYGGAEKVLETLHEIFPDADVYTTVYLPSFLGPHKDKFQNWKIKTSWLQNVPFISKLISPARLVAPFIFLSWNFSKYDVVIVSATGAYNPNLIRKGKALHICYCHTPPRYLYGYATAREWKKNSLLRASAEIFNYFLRIIDRASSKNVDYFIANSKEVSKRIEKFYGRHSQVIYPPIDIKEYSRVTKDRNYYLAGGRLARPKRIDLAIRACNELKIPLKVFGKEFAGYGEELKALAGPTVEFLGEVTDDEKIKLMSGAKAFIFPAEEEDFGMTPVEAMAAGTPVVAYKSGGVMETVIDGKTGVFFEEANVESLVMAIKKLDKTKIDSKDCVAQAKKFSKERFKNEIREFVSKIIGSR